MSVDTACVNARCVKSEQKLFAETANKICSLIRDQLVLMMSRHTESLVGWVVSARMTHGAADLNAVSSKLSNLSAPCSFVILDDVSCTGGAGLNSSQQKFWCFWYFLGLGKLLSKQPCIPTVQRARRIAQQWEPPG